jgi:hypothetical protein
LLIEETIQKDITYYFENGCNIVISNFGIQVTIIDFTLSRSGLKDKEIYYKSLDDEPEIFSGIGEDDERYGDLQFDIYRLYICIFITDGCETA